MSVATLLRRDPFWKPFFDSSVFDENLSGVTNSKDKVFSPALDVVSNKDSIVIKVELAGVDTKDVEITLDKDQLVLRGKKESQLERNTDSSYYFERQFGSFERRVSLPEDINRDEINAEFKNGLLTVTIAKVPEVLESAKKIEIKQA